LLANEPSLPEPPPIGSQLEMRPKEGLKSHAKFLKWAAASAAERDDHEQMAITLGYKDGAHLSTAIWRGSWRERLASVDRETVRYSKRLVARSLAHDTKARIAAFTEARREGYDTPADLRDVLNQAETALIALGMTSDAPDVEGG
jgi:hypothetical protein